MATKPTIASIHRYSNRFMRSTDLVRDFHDPQALEGYCLTDFGKECLIRIAEGFRPDSGRRAWRLTGDFGSGKSSFALLLANTYRDANRRLPKTLRDEVLDSLPDAKKHHFIPILIGGSREPLAHAVLRALSGAMSELYSRGAKSSLDQAIDKALRAKHVPDKKVLEFIQEANSKIIQSGKGDGLLLILDEMGKFLEFAASNPERQDVYFLQQLAEMASRSGRQPFMVVCLLHQGFNAYAEKLSQAGQREWEKVAGRFDEILFHQPLAQVASLVAAAINPNLTTLAKVAPSAEKQAVSCMEEAIQMGWYGTSASRDTLRKLPAKLYPLDPLLLPVLIRIFQRFGQNERSLFSFLCSHEPFGLRAFAQQPLKDEHSFYQLSDFYDYVRTNFGHRLGVMSYRSHWNVIESVIEAHPENPLEIQILKSIGILNLLDVDDLRPTSQAICWAVAGGAKRRQAPVMRALEKLVESKRLYFRGESRGYSLWPYTSVDIEARLNEAKKAIPHVAQISEVITEQLDARPVVARAHYIRTGNLRYFDVVYCKPEELQERAEQYQTQADGFILVPLCETESESRGCKSLAKKLPPRKDLIRLVAVPRALSYLLPAALDAQQWEWVQSNTPELNTDRIARDEVQIHLQEARNRLQSQVQQDVGLSRISGESTLSWFYERAGEGQASPMRTGRQVLHLLSDLCDRTYTKAPRIKNELVNRHNLSSAAAAARMRLVEMMFANPDKLELGLPRDRKPPEKSMYLSVLRNTDMHREESGKWILGTPESGKRDTGNVLPALKRIKLMLTQRPDERLGVDRLMEELRQPPYGVRHGLFPILLAVVAVEDEQEIAFYENGTFLREIGKDAFLRMTKAPEKFEIQFCKIEGVRSQLFQQLVDVLEVGGDGEKDVELLDVVRNLCQFVAQLPEYVRQTKNLGNPNAIKVRGVILEAREPVRMVFHDLPEACGFSKFEVGKPTSAKDAKAFVSELKQALDELRHAFPNLHRSMEKAIAEEFGYQGIALSKFRRKLAGRAEQLLLRVTENKLKAFAFRVFDEGLSESDWLNSVGSVLALRPPDKWKDEDEETFHRELQAAAGRFKRAESVAFGGKGGDQHAGHGFRVAITQADGTERQEVIHLDEKEEQELAKLEQQLNALVKKSGRLGIAAASRVIWSQLKESEMK